jgi:hypothetical protein
MPPIVLNEIKMIYFQIMRFGVKRSVFTSGLIACLHLFAASQRTYTSNSVLSSGNWYKIAINLPGIYKIDVAFLAGLGMSQNNISSSAIRLYGNGGFMLPENCSGSKTDDLIENAIWVEDGGDGIFNNSDYLLFYAPGPHEWIKDSTNRRFSHRKNLYSEQSFYFLTIGGTGKRILTQNSLSNPNTFIREFDDRHFHELDTFNFLSSGKQWFGEEFSNIPGRTLSKTFNVSFPNLVVNQPGEIVTNCLARSLEIPSRFNVRINNQVLSTLNIPAVASGPYDQFARVIQSSARFTPVSSDISVTYEYQPGSFNSQAWLDWFEIFVRRNLSMNGLSQLSFRDFNSVANGNRGEFILQNATALVQVWDITDAVSPISIKGSLQGNEIRFVNDCSSLHEYVAFNNAGYLSPRPVAKVENQNLHNSSFADFLIITHPDLLQQAQRLANYHQQRDNLRSVVVRTSHVYNEFSSGSPDPTAIRDFVKMYFDRARGDSTKRPRYLLLFGDGSFDYKSRIPGNTNVVPVYQSNNSLDPLSTYTSDDFFGFLNDSSDINSSIPNLLDIGIGRIPAKNSSEAKAFVDKIINYTDPKSLGPWRNEFTFIGDDEDGNLHLDDAEVVSNSTASVASVFNLNKIYLDAYNQQNGAGGSRYPEVNLAVSNRVFNGNLIWNYNGHGGYRRLAEEVILDQEIINQFNNPYKLPLFITATCDFAPYDNPLVSSIGENLLLREKTGAIALMTTTRLVFAFSNRVMNKNYLEAALQKNANGTYPSLGDAVRLAKNNTYRFFGDVINNRKFTLLGDPALNLSFPANNIVTTTINGSAVATIPDTLKALSHYTIEGVVADHSGSVLTGFNGTVHPIVFDKVQSISTKGNDPGSVKTQFQVQNNIVYRGKAKVINGQFTFSFVVPKDINYQFGKGRISYYSEDGKTDGNGLFTNIIVGGSGDSSKDKEGPEIKVFLNDEKFVNGGVSNEQPILLLKLADSSGISVIGNGIDHDLVAILDDDPSQKFVLNEFYESELDNFRKGIVRFQLPSINEGMHFIKVKAWDAANNSNEAVLEFRVNKQEALSLEHVLNYPNPFTTKTNFWFDHNKPGEELKIHIQIFTVTGKLVKTLRSTIMSAGSRSSEVEWDGRDDYGSKLGRGVYIYRLKVQSSDGKAVQKLEKLYIL